MDKIIELIPERLRSRKLAMASVVIYILTQLRSLGIEISPEFQAELITWVGGGYITIQGIADIITAWRGAPAKSKPSA